MQGQWPLPVGGPKAPLICGKDTFDFDLTNHCVPKMDLLLDGVPLVRTGRPT